MLQHKHLYLNVPFFLGRAAFYFAGWMFLGGCFNRWSVKARCSKATTWCTARSSCLAGPGLLFWGFSVTFMAIDWVLSLDPHWFSTMFGLLFMASQGLTAMAFLITADGAASTSAGPMSEVLTPRHLHDLGKFLLALVMVWAYFSFSQFLIIWAGNLPDEIPWYLERLNQRLAVCGAGLLVFGHFALPFALLLSRDLKRNFKLLARSRSSFW